MQVASGAAELLADLSSAMSALGARWYVFGAQAVLLYGRPRMTADVDITADLAPEALSQLISVMGGAGFDVRVDEVEAFVERTRVVPFVHKRTGMPADVVLAGPGLEMEFLARARRMNVGGLEVPVISPEDLVATKILAGRGKDLEDARGVLREQREQLDLKRVRSLLEMLEEVLDRSDLVPVLEQMRAEEKGQRQRPSRGKRSPRRQPKRR